MLLDFLVSWGAVPLVNLSAIKYLLGMALLDHYGMKEIYLPETVKEKEDLVYWIQLSMQQPIGLESRSY